MRCTLDVMFSLQGKNALVTGASRGIGAGIAKALAEQGANVAINYVASEDKAEWVSGEVRGMGRDSFIVKADVSKRNDVVAMFDEVRNRWGRIDILVNNAGVLSFGEFEKIPEEEWDRVINTNLKGQFLCSQQAVLQMKEVNYGRIINIASISSGGVGVSFPQIAHYTASKGGVIGLTENMASDLGPFGITVNAIAPGAINTDMGKIDDNTRKALINRLPRKRIGEPRDIGAAAAFLASDEADYITGAVLYVDGGWLTT